MAQNANPSSKMAGTDVSYNFSDEQEHSLVLKQMFSSFCLGNRLQLFIVLKAFFCHKEVIVLTVEAYFPAL